MPPRMPTSFQHPDINAPGSNSFQHHIQVYAPTSSHDDNEVNHFYQQLPEIIDQTPKKDILVVKGDWTDKVRKDAQAD